MEAMKSREDIVCNKIWSDVTRREMPVRSFMFNRVDISFAQLRWNLIK